MEIGQHPHHDFLTKLRTVEPGNALLTVYIQVGVGQHRAFWDARCTAGILQHRHILDRINRHRHRFAADLPQIFKANMPVIFWHPR